MGWLRVRFAPAPPPGLTWTTATLTCSWDMAWSDGVQRPPSPQYGVINALGTEFITKGGLQTDYLRVPGTDVGTNQIIGPIVKFEFSGVDSNGNQHTGQWSQQVDATATNEWDIRRQAAAALTGTNPAGTNPPGLSVSDINVTVAPYPYPSSTNAVVGVTRFATNAEATALVSTTVGVTPAGVALGVVAAITTPPTIPAAPTIVYSAGVGSAANLSANAGTSVVVNSREIVFNLDYSWNLAGVTQFNIAGIPAGWTFVSAAFDVYRSVTNSPFADVNRVNASSMLVSSPSTDTRLIVAVRLKLT
jgi:hypothetical protein